MPLFIFKILGMIVWGLQGKVIQIRLDKNRGKGIESWIEGKAHLP